MSLLDPSSAAGAAHALWRAAEARRLLGWAAGSAHPAGGFGWRTRDGGLDPSRGRPLWIACRMVHCLALGAMLGREDDREAARAGTAALLDIYRDQEHGGWVGDLDSPGGRKEAYGHAFVVLAASTASVAGVPRAHVLLEAALGTVLDRFWDEDAQMPYESYAAGFTDREDYRGGNAAMHLVEAFLAAADATGDTAWRDRATAVCTRMLEAARAASWRVPEHFDARWRVLPDYNRDVPRHPFRPFGVTPGHAFEWSRLVLTLGACHDVPAWFGPAARELAAVAWRDAWDEAQGGLVYTTDLDGTPVVRERFHWVVCEAMGAAWALHRSTADATWAGRYEQLAEFVHRHLLDPARPGAWWHELDAGNHPSERTWAGAPDVYHALQAVLLPGLPLAPGLARAVGTPASSG